MSEWMPVRKRPLEVNARGPIDDAETHEVHAGDLEADAGYYIIDDGNATYPVEPSVFRETYNAPSGHEETEGWFTVTKRPVEVEARGPLEKPERISTMEGTVHAETGNYVIRGVDGEVYPVEGDEFDRLYERL